MGQCGYSIRDKVQSRESLERVIYEDKSGRWFSDSWCWNNTDNRPSTRELQLPDPTKLATTSGLHKINSRLHSWDPVTSFYYDLISTPPAQGSCMQHHTYVNTNTNRSQHEDCLFPLSSSLWFCHLWGILDSVYRDTLTLWWRTFMKNYQNVGVVKIIKSK